MPAVYQIFRPKKYSKNCGCVKNVRWYPSCMYDASEGGQFVYRFSRLAKFLWKHQWPITIVLVSNVILTTRDVSLDVWGRPTVSVDCIFYIRKMLYVFDPILYDTIYCVSLVNTLFINSVNKPFLPIFLTNYLFYFLEWNVLYSYFSLPPPQISNGAS